MSDPRRSGAVVSLEEIFGSREFGRRPAPRVGAPVATVEAADPPDLEEVFLSAWFGRPQAIAVPAPPLAPHTGSAAGRPALVLLAGGADPGREVTRYRGAIGAVSGVAAAALVVVGMTSSIGPRPPQPMVSAEGPHAGRGSAATGASPRPGPGTRAVAATPYVSSQSPAGTGDSAGGAAFAQLTVTTPTPTPTPTPVVVSGPPPPPVEVVPSPPAPGGGTPPSGASPGSVGNVLTPVLVTAGTTVSTVGSTVTAASSDLAHAVPAASPPAGLLGKVGAAATSLGRSVGGD